MKGKHCCLNFEGERKLPTLFCSIKSILASQDVSLLSLSSSDNLFFLIKILLRARRGIFYDTLVTTPPSVSFCLSQQSYRPALAFIAEFFVLFSARKTPQFADNSIFFHFFRRKEKKQNKIYNALIPDGDNNKTNKSFWITSIKLYGFPWISAKWSRQFRTTACLRSRVVAASSTPNTWLF